MNGAAEAVQRYRSFIDQTRSKLPRRDISWLESQRSYAAERFSRLGFPTRKDEAWRYSNVGALLKHSFIPTVDEFTALDEVDIDELSALVECSHRLVFVNGRLVPGLSMLQDLPLGVSVQSLQQVLNSEPERVFPWFGRAAKSGERVFSALNTALAGDGLFVQVEAGYSLEKPIEVLYLTLELEEPVLTQPRNLVVLGEGARATLVERYASTGSSVYFNNVVSEVVLQAGADLDHYRLQEESPNAFHMGGVYVRQHADSHYQGTAIALGGSWSRTDYDVVFKGRGAQARMDGLYVVGSRQMSDFHINVEHALPECISRENFKGIVTGNGRAVFDGRIRVEKDAQYTNAHLSNDNLLLSRSAEVDTKPQLEIYADDVKCSHGATVGELDPQQLFYLRSRGIDEWQARSMLCLGFAAEVIDRCRLDGFAKQVRTMLRERLVQEQVLS